MDLHTEANAIPTIDGTDIGGLLDDLAGVHHGIDLIRDGLRHLALDRHTVDMTQTLVAVLAGGSGGLNLINTIGQLIARLADADSNPALRTLPLERQKTARREGQNTAYWLADPDLHQTASETSAAIDGV
nr:hypothetical protein OH837_48825 [Streptomyces canus]